ncbi:hypothetical protein pEaSNUABM6_00147 [Erwinia phage pEa_SNUABM_6]|nr:hypothetical protein pEaSNUABM6_00147 [Erwinia phage pEa_SNUABM_6]
MKDVTSYDAKSLAGMSPEQTLTYLAAGGKILDDTESADRLLTMMVPLRDNYYEIVPLATEYVVRTPGREYEALRAPRTVGGVILLMRNFNDAVERCGLFIATGGTGHY